MDPATRNTTIEAADCAPSLQKRRLLQAPRNTLVYLTYSDRVIEGSPQNSLTAVAVDQGTPIPLEKRGRR